METGVVFVGFEVTGMVMKNSGFVYVWASNYRDIFVVIDEFMALRFTATSPLPVAKHMQILTMTQHA
jgi:hypothetical protein